MALYGILHIPTGSFVHLEFFSHRQYLTFEEETAVWFYNQKHEYNDGEGGRPSSVYGFFIKPELGTSLKNTRMVILASSNKNLLHRIMKLDNFNEQIAMDLHNATDWDDFIESVGGDSKTVWPNKAEFSVQVIETDTILETSKFYETLPFEGNDEDENTEDD